MSPASGAGAPSRRGSHASLERYLARNGDSYCRPACGACADALPRRRGDRRCAARADVCRGLRRRSAGARDSGPRSTPRRACPAITGPASAPAPTGWRYRADTRDSGSIRRVSAFLAHFLFVLAAWTGDCQIRVPRRFRAGRGVTRRRLCHVGFLVGSASVARPGPAAPDTLRHRPRARRVAGGDCDRRRQIRALPRRAGVDDLDGELVREQAFRARLLRADAGLAGGPAGVRDRALRARESR